MLMPMMFMANMAITGATAAVYTKVRSKEEKSLVLSSAVSGLLGITEPALFGILSKYKKAFIAATIGSSLASAFISFFGVRIYGYILSSIFSLPAYIGEYFIFAVLGILIALISSYVITYVLIPSVESSDSDTNTDNESTVNKIELYSVSNGVYMPLEDVSDEIFSSKMMGDGFAFQSLEGEVFSPVDGTISTIFPTKHAIGIKTDTGIEVLVHMGINTVDLNGQGFSVFVEEGDKVGPDTLIAKMDLDYIEGQGKETPIIVVVTNMDRVQSVIGVDELEGNHQKGELINTVNLNN